VKDASFHSFWVILWVVAVVLPPDSPWNLHSSLFCSTLGANTDNTQEPGQSFKKIGLIYKRKGQTDPPFCMINLPFSISGAKKIADFGRFFSKLNQR
jgi:hypothetical protein